VEIQSLYQAAAEDVLEAAKARGREMVAEAQAVRERVLKDLARRRRVAHQQLEQLRAGRERLLEAYRVVRTTLDEATRELSVAEAEARAAAETAALRVGSQPELTIEELEAELVGARDIGLAPAPARPLTAPPPVVAVRVAHPVAEPEPVAQAESAPAPEAQLEPEPELVAQPEPEPELVAQPEPVAVAEPVAQPEPEPEPVAQPEPEPEPVAQAQPEPEPVAQAEPELVPEPEAVLVAVPEPEPSRSPEVSETAGTDERTHDEHDGQHDVEELFARLRAERAAAVARAEAVLADAPPAPGPGETVASTNGSAPSPATPGDQGALTPTSGDEDLLQARDADLEVVERSLTKALKRVLVDEQNEVLDVLRRKGGGVPLMELLPGPSDHTARYLAVVGPELRTAAAKGAGVGHEPPAVDDLAVGLAAEVADDLRARLQRALQAADGDVTTLVEGVSSAYREWKTTRAEPLARHNASAAHSRGRFSAAPPGKLRWVVDGEEGPCPDCDDNALAGAIDRGEIFPTGQPYPPAHVGCRCIIAVEHG
ncbi:MAG: hypothetical protein KY450_12670, partial [Actinobacteria bacterium]|nr:hypothetical protein [Actinomycetota bacterium]